MNEKKRGISTYLILIQFLFLFATTATSGRLLQKSVKDTWNYNPWPPNKPQKILPLNSEKIVIAVDSSRQWIREK